MWQCTRPQQVFLQVVDPQDGERGGGEGARSLQAGVKGFLQAGSLLPTLVYSLGLGEPFFSLAPHLRPLCHERPYREHNTPDNAALGFTGTHKPRHLNKVTVHGEASLLLDVVSSSGLLP